MSGYNMIRTGNCNCMKYIGLYYIEAFNVDKNGESVNVSRNYDVVGIKC